jgi:4-hydroxybenzoate polyprenyltransferase
MLVPLIKTMRPKQWSKNVFVFAALVFDLKLFSAHFLAKSFSAFVLFCAISSAVYLVNDLADIDQDRQHPTKRNRPLAAGQLSPTVAIVAALLLVTVSLPVSWQLDRGFGAVATAYLVTMVFYSFWLKNIVLVDVLTVAAGFMLRVLAGVLLVNTARFSPWLYLCMVFLALFIAISKRRHELVLLDKQANTHRSIFEEYNLPLLDEMTRLVTSCAAMAYSLYTFSAPNLPQNHAMMLTVPFVLYGLFRYMYLVHVKNQGGEPEELVLKDRPLLVTVALWGLLAISVLYFL